MVIAWLTLFKDLSVKSWCPISCERKISEQGNGTKEFEKNTIAYYILLWPFFFKWEENGFKDLYIFYDFPETLITSILHLEIESVQWLLVGNVRRCFLFQMALANNVWATIEPAMPFV